MFEVYYLYLSFLLLLADFTFKNYETTEPKKETIGTATK